MASEHGKRGQLLLCLRHVSNSLLADNAAIADDRQDSPDSAQALLDTLRARLEHARRHIYIAGLRCIDTYG